MASFETVASNVAVGEDVMAGISLVHSDIIQTHILPRLDGPTLASAACTSTQLHSLTRNEKLWSDICRSTWPSTDTSRLSDVISTFPDGSRSFFSESFPLFLTGSDSPAATGSLAINQLDRTPELISAVDVFYRGVSVFSKVVATETLTGWFRCSPFRVDLLDPKDVVPTPIEYPNIENLWKELGEDLKLSWIAIDSKGRRAMNLSSQRPVSLQRHWLSGEIEVKFALILAGDKGTSSELIQCGIVVTFGGMEGRGMQVREVSLQMEDMDGTHLNGRESLGILQRALEGRKGKRSRREEEGSKRYEEFLEMKRQRKERKLRTEGALDMMCVFLAVLLVPTIGLFFLFR